MQRLSDFISAKTSTRDRAQYAANVFVVLSVGVFVGGAIAIFTLAARGASR